MVRHLIALCLIVGLSACSAIETKTQQSEISANYWNSSYYTVLGANAANGATKPIRLQ